MRRITDHLASHHGVITRDEALRCGLTAARIKSNVRSRRWLVIAPSTYRVAGAPPTWMGTARARALASRGIVSHAAAARVYGLDGFHRARLEITVREGSSRSRDHVVRWHRSTQMHLADQHEVRQVPVTGIARTVLDLAGVVGLARLDEVIDDVLRRRLTDWAALYDVLCRHSRRGRNGCGPLRAVLDRRYGESVVPDSRWNRMVGQLVADAGLVPPKFEYEVRDDRGRFIARVDLAWPKHRLAVELDSVRFHLNSTSFVTDRRRTNQLMSCGWRVLAYTWRDYVDAPASIVAGVRGQLART